MADQTTISPETQVGLAASQHSLIVATDVSADDYMEHYAEQRCEWVKGVVYQVAPATLSHNLIIDYLYDLLRYYFRNTHIGKVVRSPFVMRLDDVESRREPDLFVVLNTNTNPMTETYIDGPADIAIEIVSPGSISTDYGAKFEEYEKGGVPEYWIFDWVREVAFFYRLNEEKLYKLQSLDEDQNYRTPLLPELVLHIPTLWQEEPPDVEAVREAVLKMLQK